MFLKSTRIVLINMQPYVTSYKCMVTVQRAIQTVFSTVCLSVCFCVLMITTLNVRMLKASLSESVVLTICTHSLRQTRESETCRKECKHLKMNTKKWLLSTFHA